MKTLIDVDEDHLRQAQLELRTTTKKDTVNQALAQVVALAARRRDLARLHSGTFDTLLDTDTMTAAWLR